MQSQRRASYRGRNRAHRVELEARRERAFSMRIAGKTYAEIAEALDYVDRGSAFRAVDAALSARMVPDDVAEHYRILQLERLERLIEAHYPAAMDGDVKRSELMLKIMERQSRLLGLDAAVKLAGADGGALRIEVEIEDARERLGDRLDELAARRAAG